MYSTLPHVAMGMYVTSGRCMYVYVHAVYVHAVYVHALYVHAVCASSPVCASSVFSDPVCPYPSQSAIDLP